jgi:hypothetical protein
LRVAFAEAIAWVMYLAVGTTAISLVFALGMEWKNVVELNKRREEEKRRKEGEEEEESRKREDGTKNDEEGK